MAIDENDRCVCMCLCVKCDWDLDAITLAYEATGLSSVYVTHTHPHPHIHTVPCLLRRFCRRTVNSLYHIHHRMYVRIVHRLKNTTNMHTKTTKHTNTHTHTYTHIYTYTHSILICIHPPFHVKLSIFISTTNISGSHVCIGTLQPFASFTLE